MLIRESDSVIEAVLAAAGRRDAVVATRILAAHGSMVEVMAMIERERSLLAKGPSTKPESLDGQRLNADNVPVDVRENDPVSVPPGDLNQRQRWYLQALASGHDVRAADIQRRWGVSEKTGRRDLASLKARGLIEFVGAFKTGRYRRNR